MAGQVVLLLGLVCLVISAAFWNNLGYARHILPGLGVACLAVEAALVHDKWRAVVFALCAVATVLMGYDFTSSAEQPSIPPDKADVG